MDKLAPLPKKLDAARTTPLSLKFQVKSVASVDKPVTITVFGAAGEEIIKTGICDASFEISDKNKGDIPLQSADGYIKLVAKDAKDEVVGVSYVSVAEWLKFDNGTLAAPMASAKESAKDDKAGKHEGPSYYNTFRECKSDSAPSKGGYATIRYQFGKGKASEAAVPEATARAATPSSKSDKDPKEVSSKDLTASELPSVNFLGGGEAGVARLRMSQASGLITKEGDIILEVFGPRPEAGKKKTTAPRIVGGQDEKETHSVLNSKGMLATRTGPSVLGKTSKGEPKHSWRAGDSKSTAMIFLDPAVDGGSLVRIHAYDKDQFLGEATVSVSDLLAKEDGNIKLKFDARKDETDARVKEAGGKLGQLQVDYSFVKGAKELAAYVPADEFTHLRLQVTRAEALKAATGSTSDPMGTLVANGKEVLKLPSIASTLYPLWGGEAAVLVPVAEATGISIEVSSKGGVFLGKTAVKPSGPAGTVSIPLSDEKGVVPADKALGSVIVTWLYETKVEKDEAKPPTPSHAEVEAPKVSEVVKEPSVRRSSSVAPPKPSFETIPDPTPQPLPTSNPPANVQANPASRSPSTKPPPIAHPADRSNSQNPAGLVADFLSDVKPVKHDVYAASATSPYVSSPTNKGAASPKKVPITVPALLKIRGADMELLESVPRANQIRFLQAILRDIADHLLLDPVQLSIVNVGAGMLIDFKFQLTEDQARRNIMDAYVQKTLAGMLTMGHANVAFVEQLGGRPGQDPRHPPIVAETAATFGEFRTSSEVAPRLDIQQGFEQRSPNREPASPLATRGSPRSQPSATSFLQSQSSPITRGMATESFQKPYVDQMAFSPHHRQYPARPQPQLAGGYFQNAAPYPNFQQPPPSQHHQPQQQAFRPPSPVRQQQQYSPNAIQQSPTQGGGYAMRPLGYGPQPSFDAQRQQHQQQQPALRPSSGGYPASSSPMGGQYQQQRPYPY